MRRAVPGAGLEEGTRKACDPLATKQMPWEKAQPTLMFWSQRSLCAMPQSSGEPAKVKARINSESAPVMVMVVWSFYT